MWARGYVYKSYLGAVYLFNMSSSIYDNAKAKYVSSNYVKNKALSKKYVRRVKGLKFRSYVRGNRYMYSHAT